MPDSSYRTEPAIRVLLLPKDTNEHGTIFGGVILSYIDLAGAVEARRNTSHRFVTVAMREVVFQRPVYVGDVVSFYTQTVKRGRTSVTVSIHVEAQRRDDPETIVVVTTAESVFVAVDATGQPTPL
ncbi:MAG: acyl-CoA thioesterase [Cyanobacteria bacterium REEB65]|nr:acyl-CoA thioesterase [Cyanobacteria bacterium REEB65]